jgi:hypothetical protein
MLPEKREAGPGWRPLPASEGNNCSDNFDLPTNLTERQALWLSRRLAVSITIARTIADLAFHHGRRA